MSGGWGKGYLGVLLNSTFICGRKLFGLLDVLGKLYLFFFDETIRALDPNSNVKPRNFIWVALLRMMADAFPPTTLS